MFLFAESGGEHQPLIVEFINHYFGEPVHQLQMQTTYKFWTWFFAKFSTTPEAVFGGPYTAENAIPWYTVMFAIACILTVAVIWMLKGKVSEDDPKGGQLTLEASFLALKGLITTVVGEQGFKYFPIVATFAVLILVSNLMGIFPLFQSPTAHVSVTFALGITSFIYYNFVGIRENGLFNHLAHFAGPKLPLLMMIIITPLIFLIELTSNLIRPFTLGIRLFANMFADEQVAHQISNLFPPYTQILVPVILLPLAIFVALVQSFVFTLLSMIYLSEVSHAPHEHTHGGEHSPITGEAIATAHV
jgi:F-type H+-transporting ATPase subunit a